RLAFLLALAWLPLLLVGLRLSRRLRVGFRAAREANSALTSRIQESVASVKVIKAYGAEAFAQERFERDSLTAFHRAFAVRSLFAGFNVAIFWIVGMVYLIATGWATVEARDTAAIFFGVWGFTFWYLLLFIFFKYPFWVST